MLNTFTFHAAHKVDNFSISLPGPVQLMRTGPFVDYNLMIAFSDSAAVNGTVSFLFSPPRAPRLRSIWQTQYLCFFHFLALFHTFPQGTAARFCPKLWNPISRLQGFSNQSGPAGGKCDRWLSDRAPLSSVITNVAKYFRSSPLCLRVITKVAKYC